MAEGAHAAVSMRRKLLWLAGLRAVAVSLLLGAAILLRINGPVPPGPVDPYFVLIALTFFVTGVCAATARYVDRWPWIVDAQVAADVVLVSLLVVATGGLDSFFAWLYVLPIVGASIVQDRRGGLVVAGLSVLAFTFIVVAQYTGALAGLSLSDGLTRVPLPSVSVALYRAGLSGAGFFAVALLAGHLADGWRRADARLEQASTEIADLQAFNQHVIDSLTGGLATTTRDRRVLTFNRAAQQITGLDAAQVRGQDVCAVLQLPGALQFALAHATRMVDAHRVEYEFTRHDGTKLLIGISAAPLRGPQSEAGFVFTFQDVTELKQRDRDAHAQKRLAAIGEMAAGIAHEIRNPLASMTGSIQILRQELPLSDDQAQLMDIVLRESERLNETITNFLAYARPQKRHLQRVDLRRVLEETAVLLRNSSERRPDHTIEVIGDPVDAGYEADEGQMRQVVWNLATNGLRAMPRGGVLRLRLLVEHVGLRPACTIAVEDEGVGIDETTRDTLFQPFKSGFTAGTGLGLAIVHRVVSDYGGLVRVSSRVGEGTSVMVRLPLAQALPAVAAADVA